MKYRYTRVIPFEITLGNTEWQNDSSISFLKTHYLENGDLNKIPGYCTSLLQCLPQVPSETEEQRILNVLNIITTALSTLRGSNDNSAFEIAKQRIFQAESVIKILVNPSVNTSIQRSESQLPGHVNRFIKAEGNCLADIEQLISLLEPSHARDVTLVRPILNRVHEILVDQSSLKSTRVSCSSYAESA